MANGPTLPPQAYTREILTAAFNWLQAQPESVKKLAVTPDALVGLYMRAQRYGASSMEADAPVSSQNFMSDLKNLAQGLKQFDEPSRPVGQGFGAHANHASANVNQAPAPFGGTPSAGNSTARTQSPSFGSPAHAAANFSAQQAHGAYHASPMAQQQAQPHLQSTVQMPSHIAASADLASNFTPELLPSSSGPNEKLNEKALQMIQEVKTNLNLSSNAEAINMMVALAHKQISVLFN